MPNREVHLRRWQLLGILTLLTLSFVVAILLVQRETRVRTNENRQLILAQHALIEKQVRQRADVTYTSCLDQNERHDKTIERLDTLLARAVKSNPSTAMQVRRARASTIFLIEALAPHQNCKQIVLDRFGFVPDVKDQDR